MQVICPPSRIRPEPEVKRIFLAGAIDMGNAVDWQAEFVKSFLAYTDVSVCAYNPRRNDWDSSWKQELENEQFTEQVNWELDKIDESDLVFFFFPATSQAPITLMEFGICAASKPQQMVVVAEKGYWRRGNLEVVCNRERIPMFSNIWSGMSQAGKMLND